MAGTLLGVEGRRKPVLLEIKNKTLQGVVVLCTSPEDLLKCTFWLDPVGPSEACCSSVKSPALLVLLLWKHCLCSHNLENDQE